MTKCIICKKDCDIATQTERLIEGKLRHCCDDVYCKEQFDDYDLNTVTDARPA